MKEDIIKMAREAGFVANVSEEPYAKLCHPTPTSTALFKMLKRFFHMAQAAEREACAKVADLVAREIDDTNGTATYIAAFIRARGQT